MSPLETAVAAHEKALATLLGQIDGLLADQSLGVRPSVARLVSLRRARADHKAMTLVLEDLVAPEEEAA